MTAIASVNKLLLTYLQVPALQCEDEPGDVSDTEEPTTLEPVDLGAILLEDPENEDDEIRLPTHRRCAAHTLNLLAAADTVSVPTWSAGPRSAFTKTKVKAQALWNAQNRRPAFAAAIKDSFGRKFITPTVTRWNSLYDSFVRLESVLANNSVELNTLCAQHDVLQQPGFTNQDMEVVQEYIRVMRPVAEGLDKIQGETTAYTGSLLPVLLVIKTNLLKENAKNHFHADNLVDALLGGVGRNTGFEARFGDLFQDEDLLMATALHPMFRMPIVKAMNPAKADVIRRRIIKEVTEMLTDAEESGSGGEGPSRESQDENFFGVLAGLVPSEATPTRRIVHTRVATELDSWSSGGRSMGVVDESLFPARYRELFVALFRRYNTAIPSSAAVERVFSLGSDILKPKRSTLTSMNFERFVLLKGNAHLLQFETPEEEDALA